MNPTVSHVASSVEVSQKRQPFAISSASCTWIPISLLTLPPYPAYKHPVCAWCTPCVPHASNALCTPLKRPGSALCAPLISSYTIRTDPTRRAHASHALHVPHIRSLKGPPSCSDNSVHAYAAYFLLAFGSFVGTYPFIPYRGASLAVRCPLLTTLVARTSPAIISPLALPLAIHR